MRNRVWLVVVSAFVVAAFSAGAAPAQTTSNPEPAWGPLSSPIRPGSSLGGYCTFNWVFYDAVLGELEPPKAYIGTAGHCTDEAGERVEHGGLGAEIGTVVYDSDEADSGVDFSLIELDEDRIAQTNPQMLGWNGPRGAITVSQLARGDRVDVYGYGLGVGSFEQTRPRFGALVNWSDDEYVADMPAVNGDSGAPLLHDKTGLALGIISRYGFTAIPPSTDTGPMMPWIFRELADAGFGDVVLATVD